MPFSKLDKTIQDNIAQMGFTSATEIQKEAIPHALQGDDLLASAKTGSGKTAAFLLPAIQRLIDTPRPDKMHPVVLILVPTRELSMQISAAAADMMKDLKPRCASIFGGQDYKTQLRILSKGCELLVATPGRLIDLMEQKKIFLSAVDLLILDEADRMLDMGFSEAVAQITKALPKKRQTLLFSATIGQKVRKFAQPLLNKPHEITVDTEVSQHSQITQSLIYADSLEHKKKLLAKVLEENTDGPAIIFTATKHQADSLAQELHEAGIKAGALHGDMKQNKRTKTIARMQRGSLSTLVATDVAARGLDLPALSLVVNFDIPMQAEDYVHRIGRTGRAGKTGDAVSLVTAKDLFLLKAIFSYTKQDIPVATIEGLEAKMDPKTAKSKAPNKRFGGRSRGPSHGPRSGFSNKKPAFGGKSKSKGPQKRRTFSKAR